MAYVTESEMKSYIKNEILFKGSSVTATLKDGIYSVFSYSTLIYRNTDKYFDNTKYSVTTSKIQNIIISLYGFNNSVLKRS